MVTVALCVSVQSARSSELLELNIYVAGLGDALQAALNEYHGDPAYKIKVTSGLSADLVRQIEHAAPANILVSSTPPLVDGLIAHGLVEADAVASPIGNSLVLIAPVNSPLTKVTFSAKTSLLPMLGSKGMLATGDPDYVALGIYAMQALSKLGQWNAIKPRLARAPDVRAALELVENEHATLGITFSTAAAASHKVKILGRFPPDTYTPIRYSFAIIKRQDGPETRKLFSYLTGPNALRIYSDYGFEAGASSER